MSEQRLAELLAEVVRLQGRLEPRSPDLLPIAEAAASIVDDAERSSPSAPLVARDLELLAMVASALRRVALAYLAEDSTAAAGAQMGLVAAAARMDERARFRRGG